MLQKMKKIFLALLISVLSTNIYTQNIKLDWAKSMGGTSNDQGQFLSLDAHGNIYSTGSYNEFADFNPGVQDFYLNSMGSFDIFVQKLDKNGDFLWAASAY